MTMGQLPVESLTLSEETRASLPGSFIALPLGVTHYQLGGPPSGRAVSMNCNAAGLTIL